MTSFSSAGVALDERDLQLVLEAGNLLLELGSHACELRVVAGGVEILARLPPLVRRAASAPRAP
jgi:hypothetical protein